MKYRIHTPLLLLAFTVLILFQSCVKEGLETSTSTFSPEPQELIGTSVYGEVLNRDGAAVSGATVSLQTRTGEIRAITDQDGNFEFLRYDNPGPSAFLRIEAANYFDGFRRLSVLPENFNYTRVKLLEKSIVGSPIQAGSGGSVSTAEGMSLTLHPNSVQGSSGNPYEGEVRVAMAWIDPSADDLPDLVVGDLSGIGLDGREASLASFGMVNVELLGVDGQELQIRDGQSAELSFPLPAARASNAPATVPLWSYNETEGYWFEESTATLIDGKYVGDVTHFSSWNCDWKGERISVNGCVNFDDGPVSRTFNMRAQVLVCSDLLGTKGGWICPDGKFLFYNFPKGEAFTLKIKDECGEVLYEESYGPFDTDTDLGIIDVVFNEPELATIIGSAITCAGGPVTVGYIKAVTDNGLSYFDYLDENGEFELNVLICTDAASVDLIVVDVENALVSDVVQVDIVPGIITIDEIEVCNEPPEFISMNIEDVLVDLFLDPYYYGPDDFFGASQESDTGYYDIQFAGLDPNPTGPETVQCDSFFMYYNRDFNDEIVARSTNPSNLEVTYTTYGANPGDVIRGSFTGEVDVTENSIPLGVKQINGTFKIIHD